ncbi:MAG: YicC family protein [Lachnospiraceae bacterium]|jgi:uncharacterized protein (TIGR00255 family)|nr:YicC family protein [Lachnospiraceae bacterium]MCI1657791.1 YicC family protein [Lachnospiraceae bacterium]MCI2196264.1 YicC family protein [Lachnospiraceae bacterium]HAD20002.1 YicC family protein [Lachnospiraceae bacterium]
MIQSMTGFGRSEITNSARKITVEIKSVNHRFLELNIRMPRRLNAFEVQIRSLLKTMIHRGKVDLSLYCEELSEEASSLRYNQSLAAEYVRYFRQVAEDFSLKNDISVSSIVHFPDVLTAEDAEPDETEVWKDLQTAVCEAAEQLIEAREKEGSSLRKDLLGKLEQLDADVAQIEARAPGIVSDYRSRIEAQAKELLGDVQIDENRLASELVLFSDKICTDEETVRLKNHIHSMRQVLENGGDVGRRLDFLAQEMNREANTILSKANDLATSDLAIDLKTGIEKIREQIQNIE